MDPTVTALGRLLDLGYLFGGEIADPWRPPRHERRGVGAATAGLDGASGPCADERRSRPGRQIHCLAKRQSGTRSSGAVPHAGDVVQSQGTCKSRARKKLARFSRFCFPGAAFRTAQAVSGGSSTPGFNALRKPRERLAPSHPLLRFLRRCAGRDTARFWPRSRRGLVRGRTRRTGGSARTAPWEPSFRSASIPAMCRPGEPRRTRHPSANRVLQDSVRSDVASPGVVRRGSSQSRAFATRRGFNRSRLQERTLARRKGVGGGSGRNFFLPCPDDYHALPYILGSDLLQDGSVPKSAIPGVW